MKENLLGGRSWEKDDSFAAAVQAEPLNFLDVYNEHFAFVWRSARAIGVATSSLDDVVQEVFIVVHKKLASFEGRSRVRTWLTGILINAVRDHRRTLRRKGEHEELHDNVVDPQIGPGQHAENAEVAARILSALDTLNEEQRQVFVLAELEEMSAPEISEALGVNLSTIYSRLRLARVAFERHVQRMKARGEVS